MLTQRKQGGFTIVELLIVIVVIGVLAALATVAFNGVSKRARDSQRMQDLATVERFLKWYAIDNNDDMLGNGSGCGAEGEGSGWWHTTESTYPRSTRTCLVDAGYTEAEKMLDPSGCSGGGVGQEACSGKPRYMIAHCLKDAQPAVYLLAQLEAIPPSSTATDTLCDGGVLAGFPAGITNWDAGYGINHVKRIR